MWVKKEEHTVIHTITQPVLNFVQEGHTLGLTGEASPTVRVGKFKGHTGKPMCSYKDNIKKCLKEVDCEQPIVNIQMI